MPRLRQRLANLRANRRVLANLRADGLLPAGRIEASEAEIAALSSRLEGGHVARSAQETRP